MKTSFPALTGVRAVAASLVCVHHWGIPWILYRPFMDPMVREAHIGVTLFFVLSGFLIFWNYFDTFELNFTWFFNYFRNRYARIFPAYWFVLVLAEGVLMRKKGLFFWFMNLTLLKSLTEKWLFDGVAPAWSLGVEETFYFLCPLFIFILRKRWGFGPWLVILFSSYLTGELLLHYCQHNNLDWLLKTESHLHFFTFFGSAFEFLIGAFLAVSLRRNKSLWSSCRFKTHLGVGLSLLVWVMMMQAEVGGRPSVLDGNTTGLILNNILLPIALCLLLWGLCFENTIVQRLLSTRPALLLGKASYVFYLVHGSAIFPWLQAKLVFLGASGTYFACYISLQLFSILVFKLLEEPANLWLKGYLLR